MNAVARGFSPVNPPKQRQRPRSNDITPSFRDLFAALWRTSPGIFFDSLCCGRPRLELTAAPEPPPRNSTQFGTPSFVAPALEPVSKVLEIMATMGPIPYSTPHRFHPVPATSPREVPAKFSGDSSDTSLRTPATRGGGLFHGPGRAVTTEFNGSWGF